MNFLDNKTTISYYFGPRSTFWSTLKETLYVKLENNQLFSISGQNNNIYSIQEILPHRV
jgi:hypothetical protein